MHGVPGLNSVKNWWINRYSWIYSTGSNFLEILKGQVGNLKHRKVYVEAMLEKSIANVNPIWLPWRHAKLSILTFLYDQKFNTDRWRHCFRIIWTNHNTEKLLFVGNLNFKLQLFLSMFESHEFFIRWQRGLGCFICCGGAIDNTIPIK